MAIFSKIVFAFAAIAPLVSAVPLNARQPVTDIVTETATTTVDIAVTVWVDENGNPIATDFPAVPGGFVASTPTTSAIPTLLPASSPSSVAPSVPTSTTPIVTAPAAAPSTTMITQVAPSTPNNVVAPAPSTTTKAASASTSQASDTNSGTTRSTAAGPCVGAGTNCVGDITHWDGGLGACGWNVNTNSDMQIALPVGFMGSLSNSNPYCGQSVTIKNPNTGATIQATVGDKCMGCTGYSIDLTNALFNAIGGGCDGRCSGFQWWLN